MINPENLFAITELIGDLRYSENMKCISLIDDMLNSALSNLSLFDVLLEDRLTEAAL